MMLLSPELTFLRAFLGVVLAVGSSAAPMGGTAAPRATARPPAGTSVLLITLDTTRADHLGCYGSKVAATPNLDAIARSGALFENAISPAPLTLPSHCTIMTGLAPRHHGVRDNAVFRLGETPPTLASILRSRGYATAAAVSAAVLDRRTGIARGFDTYGDQVRIRARSEFNYEERGAAQVTDEALAMLSKLRPPYFLWVHYYDPHYPYVPPPPFGDRFRSNPYDGEIAYADFQIGRLLAALGRAGAERSTLVVVAGDHGEALGEHGEDRHDVFVYQATQHVPLIFKGPGIATGRRIVERVGLVDVFPTILGLLHLPIPRPTGLDGVSLAALVTGQRGADVRPLSRTLPSPAASSRAGASPSRVFEMESFFPAYSYNWTPALAVVSDRWKYISAPRPELYDLATDPRESRNVLEGLGLETAGALRAGPQGPGSRGAPSGAADPVAIASRLAAELRSRYASDRPARDFGAPSCVRGIEASCPGSSPTPGTSTVSGGSEDSEQREHLAALGYVGGSVVPGSSPPPGPHLDPKDGIATVRELDRARGLLQTGRASEAAGLLEPIARREPRNFPVLATLGAASLEAGSFDRAIEVHRTTISLRPDYELPHSNLAGALRAKAASLDGASPGVAGSGPANPRAEALREEAAKEYEEALRLDRRDSESFLGYARLELERSRPAAAREVLRRADRAEAGDPEIYVLLGRLEASLGSAEAARKALERALALDERSGPAHEALGHLDYDAGNPRSAAAHYARALELSPSPALAKTLGAIRLHDLDDRPGARAAFRRALDLAPDAPDAGEIVEILKELEPPR